MKCPHCTVEIHEAWQHAPLGGKAAIGVIEVQGNKRPAFWSTDSMECPACSKAIIRLEAEVASGMGSTSVLRSIVYPRFAARPAAPPEAPGALAEDFNEARLVLGDSPKASAALARRCLQGLLRLQGFNQKDLAPAIDAVLAAKILPSALAESVDAVRNIGNFAAHPMKDTNSGEILPVEDHEAEWNLDVLEGLFDFFYVQPAKAQLKKAALNAKLQAAGKPPIK